MLVFWQEKLVLLAVPKTGTTALEAALSPRASMVLRDPPHLKHSPVFRYRRFLDPFFTKAGGQEMQTMAVVRHPVDWLSSWYRYRNRDALVGQENSTRGVSFDQFVEEYCKGKPAPYAAVGLQATFVTGPKGDMGVDHLFQYEAMDRAREFLEKRLKQQIVLPQKNVSPQFDVTLDQQVRAKFERKRAAEFDLWSAAQS